MKWAIGIVTGALSFAYLIFVLNSIQMLSLLLLPISPRTVRQINRWCARSIWGLWVLMAERLYGIKVTVRGDALPWRENAFVLPNHQSMADILLLLSLAWRCGRVGDLKFFAKNMLKYVPGPGWGMWLIDCIFLKRDWMKDKGRIMRLFAKYKANEIPLFLVSFLEGTRRNPTKAAASQAYAKERGHYVPNYTMVPRTKGFLATMLGLRSHLDAVYDVTIGYHPKVPSLYDCFIGNVQHVELHVARFPIDELPEDDEALSNWVFERFEIKDKLLEAFAAEGQFPGESLYGDPTPKQWFTAEGQGRPADL